MIDITIDQNQFEEIKKALTGSEKSFVSESLKKSINETAKSGQTLLLKEAKKAYTIKVGGFKKDMSIDKATKRKLYAVIRTKGKPNPLYQFRKKDNTDKDPAKAKVLKESKLKELEYKGRKAFIATMPSGHVGIFQRLNNQDRKKQEDLYSNRWYSSGKKTHRKVKRNAIKQLYGVSTPQMIGNEKKVYGKVAERMGLSLQEGVEKYMDKMLGGKG